MNEYQLLEASNMQPDTDPHTMPLTPRLELKTDGKTYMNICDLTARADVKTDGTTTRIETHARLVDKDQNNPPAGEVRCAIIYIITPQTVRISFQHEGTAYTDAIKTIIPLIAPATDTIADNTAKNITLKKRTSTLRLTASANIEHLPTTAGRIFNFVPGLEAIPLQITGQLTHITIEVLT